jgi:hypothetical protein
VRSIDLENRFQYTLPKKVHSVHGRFRRWQRKPEPVVIARRSFRRNRTNFQRILLQYPNGYAAQSRSHRNRRSSRTRQKAFSSSAV